MCNSETFHYFAASPDAAWIPWRHDVPTRCLAGCAGDGGYALSLLSLLQKLPAYRMQLTYPNGGSRTGRESHAARRLRQHAVLWRRHAHRAGREPVDGKLDVCQILTMNPFRLFCMFPTVYFRTSHGMPEVRYSKPNASGWRQKRHSRFMRMENLCVRRRRNLESSTVRSSSLHPALPSGSKFRVQCQGSAPEHSREALPTLPHVRPAVCSLTIRAISASRCSALNRNAVNLERGGRRRDLRVESRCGRSHHINRNRHIRILSAKAGDIAIHPVNQLFISRTQLRRVGIRCVVVARRWPRVEISLPGECLADDPGSDDASIARAISCPFALS